MLINVSIPDHVAYGADEAMPDRAGMNMDDAIYHTVHNYPGGVVALAARMGVPASTLTHKANPNNATHRMSPAELVAMQLFSGNVSVLQAMASALGYTCQLAVPDQAGGSAVQAVMRLTCAQADFARAVADPLGRMEGDGTTWVTPAEKRRADYMGAALHSEVDNTLATLRTHMRPTPKVGG